MARRPAGMPAPVSAATAWVVMLPAAIAAMPAPAAAPKNVRLLTSPVIGDRYPGRSDQNTITSEMPAVKPPSSPLAVTRSVAPDLPERAAILPAASIAGLI